MLTCSCNSKCSKSIEMRISMNLHSVLTTYAWISTTLWSEIFSTLEKDLEMRIITFVLNSIFRNVSKCCATRSPKRQASRSCCPFYNIYFSFETTPMSSQFHLSPADRIRSRVLFFPFLFCHSAGFRTTNWSKSVLLKSFYIKADAIRISPPPSDFKLTSNRWSTSFLVRINFWQMFVSKVGC